MHLCAHVERNMTPPCRFRDKKLSESRVGTCCAPFFEIFQIPKPWQTEAAGSRWQVQIMACTSDQDAVGDWARTLAKCSAGERWCVIEYVICGQL